MSKVLLLLAFAAGAPAYASSCPAPPAGPKDIRAVGFYTNAAKSVIDEAARQTYADMISPLRDFNKRVAALSDLYLSEREPDAADCAATWLDRWAQDGAMLGSMVHINNDQADYVRQWLLGSFAIEYIKIKPAASAERRSRIESWLKALAIAVLPYWDSPKHKHNNHYYWTGVGVMAAGIAAGETSLIEAARRIYEKGIGDIRDDGSLPMEMARGQRAFHYHNFALEPLVMMAEMSRALGEDWYGCRHRRIDLLADRVAAGYRNPDWFAEQSGFAQVETVPTGAAGWVEYYRLHSDAPERFESLHDAGPFDDPRVGGNLTVMARSGLFESR